MGTSGGASESSGNGKTSAAEDRRSQIRASWAQVAGSGVSAAAVIVAVVVACQGQQTINHNSQTTQQQSEDTQLSTAITALGSSEMAERVAGLQLLERNVSARFTLAPQTGESAVNVFGDYTTGLEILSGYVNSHSGSLMTGKQNGKRAPFGRGYGAPPVPLDVVYAADQISQMLDMKGDVVALNAGQPAIDLSNDELYGQPWTGVNFRWIKAYLAGIDLRGAYLESSKWGKRSDLSHSYLQCANLRDADFRGADLTYADLRGANVQGADFRGAKLKGAKLKGGDVEQIYGTASWPRWVRRMNTRPASEWNQATCLQDKTIQDMPASASAPASPGPSSSPTPGSSPGQG
jgi:hypothetical protein